MKMQATVWPRRMYLQNMSDERLVSKNVKEFLNLTTQFKKWAKYLNRYFIQEDMQMENNYMKGVGNHLSLGNCKFKQ